MPVKNTELECATCLPPHHAAAAVANRLRWHRLPQAHCRHRFLPECQQMSHLPARKPPAASGRGSARNSDVRARAPPDGNGCGCVGGCHTDDVQCEHPWRQIVGFARIRMHQVAQRPLEEQQEGNRQHRHRCQRDQCALLHITGKTRRNDCLLRRRGMHFRADKLRQQRTGNHAEQAHQQTDHLRRPGTFRRHDFTHNP